ncbi:MAG: hypothetical protein PHU63_03890, partial [Candidatus ainarchaeum sp.]|nr:hypothetical protein [Candidatus ainarchaeum sp.]
FLSYSISSPISFYISDIFNLVDLTTTFNDGEIYPVFSDVNAQETFPIYFDEGTFSINLDKFELTTEKFNQLAQQYPSSISMAGNLIFT